MQAVIGFTSSHRLPKISLLFENLNTTYSMYSKGSDHLNPLDDMDIFFHTQHEQNGLGHAIMMAREAIDGPFLVLLGDNILTSSHASLSEFQASNVSKQLVRLFEEHDQPSAAVYNVGINRVSNYGIVLMKEGRIVSIVEKPSKEEAPSTYALCGRYVFAKNTFELLDRYSVEEYGELQSIALMKHWMDSGHLHAHVLPDSVSWYDSGLPFEWLKSQIDHALRRPEYAEELQEWLNKTTWLILPWFPECEGQGGVLDALLVLPDGQHARSNDDRGEHERDPMSILFVKTPRSKQIEHVPPIPCLLLLSMLQLQCSPHIDCRDEYVRGRHFLRLRANVMLQRARRVQRYCLNRLPPR